LEEQTNIQHPYPPVSGWKKYIGYVFLASSFLSYVLALSLPLTNISIASKALLFAIFITIAEVSFVISAVILGKEYVIKYRRYLNPLNWFKKKKT
jgi:hypothetical protein